MKRMVSMLLTFALLMIMCVPASAQTSEDDYTIKEYVTAEGIRVEEVSFEENGEFAAVIKKTYPNNTFDVQAINGTNVVNVAQGVSCNIVNNLNVVDNAQVSPASMNDEYPIWTPYWYAGYDDYSQNGTALTVAILAGIMVASTGMGAGIAYSTATTVYAALGSNIYDDIYFRTYRYYATLEEAPYAVTWYTKFVTYTYSDGAHTNLIAGPCEEVYTGPAPM